MTDPTLQARLDDALIDAQRLRNELRIARAMVEDAEGYIKLQADQLNKLTEELRTIGTRLARCHCCGTTFAPCAGEVTCAPCSVRRAEIAAASKPAYRAEPTQTEAP